MALQVLPEALPDRLPWGVPLRQASLRLLPQLLRVLPEDLPVLPQAPHRQQREGPIPHAVADGLGVE